MDWIEVNGTSLRYELSGTGDKVLVLVHEMGGTLDSWDQVVPALNHARRVLRYDTRGAGISEKIGGKVTFDDMADDLAALLDATGIAGKVAIAGTAVGGAIAIHFAVRHAARAGALAVTSPATGILSISAKGRTAAQAEATANAVAGSYTAYVDSRASLAGFVSAHVLESAGSATGTQPLKKSLLVTGLIGVPAGALIGIIVSLAIGRRDLWFRQLLQS